MKNRVIKITEAQLREAEGNAFEYLDSNNDIPNNVGNSEIGVTGKIDGEEYGTPATSDKISNTMSNQSWNRFRGYSTNMRPNNLREEDENNDGVDDFYNHDELNILTDDNDKNNLIKIPNSIEQRLNILIKSIENLQPKQQAMVINKIIDSINVEKIPYSWAKELMYKILAKNKIDNNDTLNK